jgi:hypothetical protein
MSSFNTSEQLSRTRADTDGFNTSHLWPHGFQCCLGIWVVLNRVCLGVNASVARVQHHRHAPHNPEQAAAVHGVQQVAQRSAALLVVVAVEGLAVFIALQLLY